MHKRQGDKPDARRSRRQPGFSMVPVAVVNALPYLDRSALRLAVMLGRYMDRTWRCYPSTRELMERAGIKNWQTFRHAREQLREHGLRWKRQGRHTLAWWWVESGVVAAPRVPSLKACPDGGDPSVGEVRAPVTGEGGPPSVGEGETARGPHENKPSSKARAAAEFLHSVPNLSNDDAQALLAKHGAEAVLRVQALCQRREQHGGLRNPAGFLRSALVNKWADEEEPGAAMDAWRAYAVAHRGARVNDRRLDVNDKGVVFLQDLVTGHIIYLRDPQECRKWLGGPPRTEPSD